MRDRSLHVPNRAGQRVRECVLVEGYFRVIKADAFDGLSAIRRLVLIEVRNTDAVGGECASRLALGDGAH